MNAELHPPRRARRGNQEALIAWLDEQERILRMRGILFGAAHTRIADIGEYPRNRQDNLSGA